MALQIEQVTDERGARAFHALDAETTPVDHPGQVAEPLEAIIGMLPNPLPSFRVSFFLGTEDDEVVATAFYGLPQVENTHTCHLHVTVGLDARRRGYGTQMVDFVFDEARRAGRRQAIWNTGGPLDGSSPGDAMSERLGAKPALGSIRRELVLSELDRADLERRLDALREGPCADYELRSWIGRCPDDLVEGAAQLVPIVMSDAPQGELDMEVEAWDVERYREFEAMLTTRQRDSFVAAAVDRSTGRVVAYTDLNVPLSEHRVASQMGTAVVPDHRGHRLGLAVKLVNVLNLLDGYPDTETIHTVNAAENEYMVAVNTALGFHAVERSTVWQLDL
jgi:GNAT superfamily N-acetyltransferase